MSGAPTKDAFVGGAQPVVLRRESATRPQAPEFVSATFLPGLGMNLFQACAYFPRVGEVELLASPPLAEAALQIERAGDDAGVQSFRWGGAMLLPFANRIRGRLSADGKHIEARLPGSTAYLQANWSGKRAGAERCAIHGLILAERFDVARAENCVVEAVLRDFDFRGRWSSKADIEVHAILQAGALELLVRVCNTGGESLPVGIGWHPYFALPGGDRRKARLRLPGCHRALVNNYDDVFPTGQIVPVAGSVYDFTAKGGAPLGDLYLDDCFVDLERTADKRVIAEIFDPIADHGVRLSSQSPHVKALQVYAPPGENFIALEPQFNFTDPFGAEWPHDADTGMVLLSPGEDVAWQVRCELFTGNFEER